MERNLRDMADFAKDASVKLTPHSKTHKVPEFALMQINYGAAGICTQKVSEAEVMADNGVKNILISNEIIGLEKLRRLANLSKKIDLRVCVDSLEGVNELSQAAKEADVRIKCIVEVENGYHRCGVTPAGAAQLAKQITQTGNLAFQGIMGYEGQVGSFPRRQWPSVVKDAMTITLKAKRAIEENGIHVEDVVVGGTPSAKISGRYPGITEITPGEYIFYDYANVKSGLVPVDACALTVKSTVMSRPIPNRAIVDGGLKTFGFAGAAYPHVKNDALRAHVTRLSEEHGILKLTKGGTDVKIGDILEFVPYRVGPCVNLHDKMYLTRNGHLEKVVPILGRGMTT
jgi:D-serine deaminase-like pyridoxal phosphate-dependent protein